MKFEKNYAQKAQEDSSFYDNKATKGKERLPSGSSTEVTRYSDGSSLYDFGGPVGKQAYDKYGEEC